MLEKPIITLTTDFGLKDPFVGLMKGVILGINPDAIIIDITHNISRHNIFDAAHAISMSYKYFPSTTIHVVVVDPGVGGSRRPVLVVTEDYYFIGPDNGIFTPIYESARNHFFKVINITATHYFLPMSGFTFHGRDIFAPIAAYLSKGLDSQKFGEQIKDYTKIEIPRPVSSSPGSIAGEIVSIDNFGNAISNITRSDLAGLSAGGTDKKFKVTFNNNALSMVSYYAECKTPDLTAIINSFGHLELFTYRGRAAEKFGIKIRDSVTVTLV